MGLDTVERFFKLTLDNVYRFTCSLLFAVTVLGAHSETAPVEGLTQLLDWLAVPSAWLSPVGEWVIEREAAVGTVAALILIVAVFAATNDWHSRSGSTALLSIVILVQVGQGIRVFTIAIIILVALVLITGVSYPVARRIGLAAPGWPQAAWEKVLNVAITLLLAALYLFSPLGWLISQEPSNARGTRLNPLYIDQVGQPGPTGALPLRSRPQF